MEITTNTQTTNTYTQTKQKENSSSDISFGQYMDTKDQYDTKTKNTTPLQEDYIEINNTTEQTQTLTYTKEIAQTEPYDPKKKFLNFLDEKLPNYFEKNGISKEIEEVIRNVLDDNQISESEVNNLSFEESQTIIKMQFNQFEYGIEDTGEMMLIPIENSYVQSIMGMTIYSKDDTLNRAIHKTFTENYTSDTYENTQILEALTDTLKQAYEGMELGFNYHQAPTPFGLLHEFENLQMDIDYNNHLLKVLNHVDIMLNKANEPGVKELLNGFNKGFELILENYRELKNEKV
jgi:hypothetical protein